MAKRTLLARLEAKERELDRLIIAGADLDEIVKAHGEECEAHDRYERAETGRQRALATKIGRSSCHRANGLRSATAWEDAMLAIRYPIPCMEAQRGRNSGLTHCHKGHEFTPENTYTDPKGQRHCRTCNKAKRNRGPKIINSAVLAVIRGEK